MRNEEIYHRTDGRAILNVSEDSPNAGMKFYIGNKASTWEGLTRSEQLKVIDGLAGMVELCYRFIKSE